jgi:hypothetical protein
VILSNMLRRLTTALLLSSLLTACLPATVTLLPTLSVPADTAGPSATLPAGPAIGISTPDIVLPTSELLPVPPEQETQTLVSLPTDTPPPVSTAGIQTTQAATAVPQPDADAGAIQLYSPGPLSKVVSPVTLYGYAIPGYENKGRVDLYGEDGRLLAGELLQLNTIYKWAYFYWDLPFEISAAGELGRLSLSTRDQYGLITAVYSVHLLLLPEGLSILNPSGNLDERCVLERPVAGKNISGGSLAVAGKFRPFNDLPLVVELTDGEGTVIASQLVSLEPSLDGGYVPFSSVLTYSVSNGTWALLVVRQPDERISGTMYLYSREIYLSP